MVPVISNWMLWIRQCREIKNIRYLSQAWLPPRNRNIRLWINDSDSVNHPPDLTGLIP
jgi:hypothetical protein